MNSNEVDEGMLNNKNQPRVSEEKINESINHPLNGNDSVTIARKDVEANQPFDNILESIKTISSEDIDGNTSFDLEGHKNHSLSRLRKRWVLFLFFTFVLMVTLASLLLIQRLFVPFFVPLAANSTISSSILLPIFQGFGYIQGIQELSQEIPECNITGISCNADGGISGLFLWNSHLNGTIPREIGMLESLEILRLSVNKLTGTIPTELGYLKKLERLDLYYNQLTGSIPNELGNLKNLKLLELIWNKLTGSIPSELAKLENLEELDLWGNKLTGSIPTKFGMFGRLYCLKLHSNKLTGTIPKELHMLKNLEAFSLYENELSGSVPYEVKSLFPYWSTDNWYNRVISGNNALTLD